MHFSKSSRNLTEVTRPSLEGKGERSHSLLSSNALKVKDKTRELRIDLSSRLNKESPSISCDDAKEDKQSFPLLRQRQPIKLAFTRQNLKKSTHLRRNGWKKANNSSHQHVPAVPIKRGTPVFHYHYNISDSIVNFNQPLAMHNRPPPRSQQKPMLPVLAGKSKRSLLATSEVEAETLQRKSITIPKELPAISRPCSSRNQPKSSLSQMEPFPDIINKRYTFDKDFDEGLEEVEEDTLVRAEADSDSMSISFKEEEDEATSLQTSECSMNSQELRKVKMASQKPQKMSEMLLQRHQSQMKKMFAQPEFPLIDELMKTKNAEEFQAKLVERFSLLSSCSASSSSDT